MNIINKINSYLNTIITQRTILATLVIRDFKSRYLSSYLGLPWAFIRPTVYIFVIWFAFTFGLRSGSSTTGLPFAAWLICGMIPWLFISQTMIMACSSITEYGYLIKKTSFPVMMIPIIKILSGMIVHAILLVVVAVMLVFGYNINPSIYWLQIIYYLFVTIILLTGISLTVASINVFVKDMAHIVNIIVTILFWATPIIWPFTMLQGNYKYIALLNPFFYITEGYRYTFLEKRWFYEFPEMNLLFWTVTILILILGFFTFNKLRPDFGDEL